MSKHRHPPLSPGTQMPLCSCPVAILTREAGQVTEVEEMKRSRWINHSLEPSVHVGTLSDGKTLGICRGGTYSGLLPPPTPAGGQDARRRWPEPLQEFLFGNRADSGSSAALFVD